MRRVLAVCIGAAAPLVVTDRGTPETVMSGIVKTPIGSLDAPIPVQVGALGLEGDEQADHLVHGGLEKAVYVYPVEHYAFWQTVRGQAGVQRASEALPPGALGENLLIEGLLESQAWVGDHLCIGEVELRIERPRQPCYKLNARLGFKWAAKMMVQSGYTGFYCAVVRKGRLAAGDEIILVPGPRVLTVEQTHRIERR